MALSAPGQRGPSLGHNSNGGGARQLAACVVVSLVLITVSSRMGQGGPLEAVRGAFMTVTTPIRYLGATVSTPFQGLGNIFANLTADQATLSDLKAENERLQARNAELEESEQTATRLQQLLDIKDTYNLQSAAARIISGSADSWSSTVTIDKGTADGLSVGMPVSASNGVIGQIVQCGATSSTVRLLTDESSSVSAMVQSNRAQGMVVGSASGQVSLTLIRSSQTVNVGDVVVTSGLGGVFPKGLPIGKVTSVQNNPGSLYLDVVVEPFAHTESFEEVLVITSLTQEQQANAQDISEADAQEGGSSASTDAAAGDGSAAGDASGSSDGSTNSNG